MKQLTKAFIFLILLIPFLGFSQEQKAILSGKIIDSETQAPVEGATIYFPGNSFIAITNSTGDFSIELKEKKYSFTVRHLTYKIFIGKFELKDSLFLKIELEPKDKLLDEVVISTERSEANLSRAIGGVEKMSSKTIRKMPTLMGESDVVRSILALPGVSTIGEGASGFNVRGGNVDQNLVLLDGVPLYNTSHLFGFFTAFNSELVSDLSLYKGGIPSNFGGRSSSVLNVRLKEGDYQKWNYEFGLGQLSSQFSIDGPIKENKTSLLIGGRTSLSDFYLKFFPNKDVANSKANFYDLNIKLAHKLNDKNKLTLGFYRSNDQFKFSSDTTYFWETNSINLNLNTLINPKLSHNFSTFYSDYQYGIRGDKKNFEFIWKPNLCQFSIKDFILFEPKNGNSYEFGIEFNQYKNNQGTFAANSGTSIIQNFYMPTEYAKDGNLYINTNFLFKEKFSVNLGLRYSIFGNFGEAKKYLYQENIPKFIQTITDTIFYKKGELIKAYGGFEPRLAVSYRINEGSSLKMGYNRMRQYMHLLSNTMAISPVDIWKFSDQYVKPQVVDQYSLGFFKAWESISKGSFEASIESYYKNYQNIIDYIDGANLYLNPSVETDLLNARGRSYGIEWMLKKTRGIKSTGWVSYTYSRSFRQSLPSQTQLGANFGYEFPSNFDIPHSVKMVWNYRLNKRFSFNANFNYSSGRPITYPNGRYKIYAFSDLYDYAFSNGIFPRPGTVPVVVEYYGNIYTYMQESMIKPLLDGYSTPSFTLRNQERIPFYMRLDVGITIEPKEGTKKQHSWNFSIYNLFSRANVYSIFFRSSTGKINQAKAFELSVLGAAIPSLTYQLKI